MRCCSECWWTHSLIHYNNIIMSMMASPITSLTIVYSTFIQAQIKENIKAPRHWSLWNLPGTGEFPTQMASCAEMFPFDDVIMYSGQSGHGIHIEIHVRSMLISSFFNVAVMDFNIMSEWSRPLLVSDHYSGNLLQDVVIVWVIVTCGFDVHFINIMMLS